MSSSKNSGGSNTSSLRELVLNVVFIDVLLLKQIGKCLGQKETRHNSDGKERVSVNWGCWDGL